MIHTNDIIRVKLTERGKNLIQECYIPIEDDGWIRMSLWELVAAFGIYTSLTQAPCFTAIEPWTRPIIENQ